MHGKKLEQTADEPLTHELYLGILEKYLDSKPSNSQIRVSAYLSYTQSSQDTAYFECIFNFLKKCMYLESRVIESQRERENFSLPVHTPSGHNFQAWAKQRRDPGTPSRSPVWATGIQVHLLLLPQAC